ncbi:hypothetical protein Ea357_078 [Erwinia phage Ea35-70]|uniref:Uncharacterized protein n=1 Tax=Erwinia phage Ea35-70 TaxID=1429768 RepID=W6B1E2_9CAUD|nr:hypothetical protein Ea357_078 [Erwinia phage Ea35-70]AHI60229.1 hypothetical protein Ea357_078 [Erwinia phage Ea35-70]
MSEITFKDARYYDLITKEQLQPGHTILLSLKGQPAGVMTPAVQWAKDNLENTVVVYGTVDDLQSIRKEISTCDQPVAVVLTGGYHATYELTHWARENNVVVFLASDTNAPRPRYAVLLGTCLIQLTYDHTGRVSSATAIRNQATASGWVIDFTADA